eukprot:m.193331 g.193331  ORF g.193331 m.193331 type:complete len:349 (-) comp14879_c0_seq1:2853-3899(-)
MALLSAIRQLWHESGLLQEDVEALDVEADKQKAWAALFDEHFVVSDTFDDLIFYILRNGELAVYRRGQATRPLPGSNDSSINWIETTCLNFLMQATEYHLTLAICKQPGTVLKPHTYFIKQLYASPSHRSMDTKGKGDEITYPLLHFMVDDFDTYFEQCTVLHDDTLSLEIHASVGEERVCLLTGCLSHSGLAAEARTNLSSHSVFGRIGTSMVRSVQGRDAFVEVTAPNKEAGLVQLAVRMVGPEEVDDAQQQQEQEAASGVAGWFSRRKVVSKVSKAFVSAAYMKSLELKSFVTYFKLTWRDIMGKLCAPQTYGRTPLHDAHQRHIARAKKRAQQRQAQQGDAASS